MLFNSIDFAVFLPIVFGIYWFLFQKNLRIQNAFLVLVSYIFYGWWDWRFLILLLISTLIDFGIGLMLTKEESRSKRLWILWTGISFNLLLLFFFKYYHFFYDSFVTAFRLFGMELSTRSLSIILPVGISFYTFQSISYSIDVYRKKIEPTRDIVSFLAYVSFFPQLVAGPIERGTHLLPQFFKSRQFDHYNAVRGMRQILWGLFKKVLIADNCAEHINYIFSDPAAQSGSNLMLGVFLFSFQIYGDFSGYSDIAIGTARLFGFELMQNFAFPYFSPNISSFWRRWHISLSTWFRDYLYIPLGGNKEGRARMIRNTFIVFMVSGFWHGANWTFLAWGLLHFIYMLPTLVGWIKYKQDGPQNAGSFKDIPGILMTFLLVMLAWVFFRANDLPSALQYLSGLFSVSLFSWPELPSMVHLLTTLCFIGLFVLIEWNGRRDSFGIEKILRNQSSFLRWLIYIGIIMLLYFYGNFSESIEFIYFQF